MSNTVKERITVSGLSKFGFKIGEEYVNYSKKLPESDKTQVVPGAEFDAELFIADSGKRYLNKIVGSTVDFPAKAVLPRAVVSTLVGTAPMVVPSADAKKFVPKFQKKETVADSERMSKADWSAKDRSQLIGGLSHDAAAIASALVTVVGAISEPSEALEIYKTLLEGMLKVREELK